ncbi:MAG: universal stress protein [Saprospiraceae bacterium]|nr:universal stress protein [Saprospiraceae bacterium]
MPYLMLNIKIYGPGTSSYQLVKSKLTDALDHAHIEYTLKEVQEISTFINDGVVSVPAIKVDEKYLFEIKPNGAFNQSLRDAVQSILKMSSYGALTKIIVPTDFSEASFNAYNYANNMAKVINGVLLLTHVYYPTSIDVNQFSIVDETAENVHRERLNNLVKSVNQDWIGSFMAEPLIEGVFKVGFPKLELIEMSKTENAVIVMGTTGVGDTFKKIFGSLSLDLIDDCYCPLFLIPPDIKYSKMDEVSYLSENLKNDTLHLIYAGKLCVALGVKLRLVHFSKSSDDEYDVKDAISILENYYPTLKYHIEILDTDNLLKEVSGVIHSPKKSLVILSTKHRNIISDIFHKSVSEFAAKNSSCPLLILSDRIK